MICPRHFEQVFEGTPSSVSAVRRFLTQVLASLPVELIDDATLCGSELATNAIRHTRSGERGGKFVLVTVVTATHVQVLVIDQGSDTEPEPGRYEQDSFHGLDIVCGLGVLTVEDSPSGRRVSALLSLPTRPEEAFPK